MFIQTFSNVIPDDFHFLPLVGIYTQIYCHLPRLYSVINWKHDDLEDTICVISVTHSRERGHKCANAGT